MDTETKTSSQPSFIASVGLLLGGVMYTSFFLISSLRWFSYGFNQGGYATLAVASFGVVMIGLGARKFFRWLRYQPEGTGPVESMEEWRKEHE